MTTERNRSTGRPTLEEVAERAGVGRGTVSRVVNGSSQVSPQARMAVQQAIEELSYVPNRAARALVTSRTDSVALVVSQAGEGFFAEPFFGRVTQAVSETLAGTGLQQLLVIVQSRQERRLVDEYLTRQHIDGALLLSLRGNDTLQAELEERGVPTVRAGRPARGQPACFVDADDRGGAQEAVSHLVERGRRRVVAIVGPHDAAAGAARLAGYRDVVGAGLVAYGDVGEDGGAAAMRELLDRQPDLDAVFAASDSLAATALRVLEDAGRRVPDDVAIVGFGDSILARHTRPALTTVHQPVEAVGREMTRLLLARIHGEPVGRAEVVLDTRLVVRESS
ncbi:MAG: putative LacI-family transcriptional regulator [Dactylosporangium sp.]|jgi:DNA-binding LacI/PurR family transcriptional regulator|nr:putative LacI-family transcriptional regulator [Dactylosporangium sp.]